MNKFKTYFTNRYLPRWIVLVYDLSILGFSYFVALWLFYSYDFYRALGEFHFLQWSILLMFYLFGFYRFKPYSGILRHSTLIDSSKILFSLFFSTVLIFLFIYLDAKFKIGLLNNISRSVVVITAVCAFPLMVIFRLVAKIIFQQNGQINTKKRKVMIFGAGELGKMVVRALESDAKSAIEVVAFIDDLASLQNKFMVGKPIYSIEKALNKIAAVTPIDEVILAVNPKEISKDRKFEITELCIERHILVKEIPPVETWINGGLRSDSLQNIKIEDLLGRDVIKLDRLKIEVGLQKSIVFVSGAAGSIGSEIVRQLIAFGVKRVILFDKAESELYNLQQELIRQNTATAFKVVLGDVTNKMKLRKIFSLYRPTIVINAAAYKHVPLMEEFPAEAVRVNVGGTKILADIAMDFGVQKFVFISSDKAVNPTNVMGATKRVSEIYIQSLAQSGKGQTQFITTRFGNVLGSNGSVVPLFKKQIECGGPVTVTHKNITRFFMTIPEACQLVLEAAFMGKGGEIFIFDMGEPVKIYDLAKKMIVLSGLIPGKDIDIKVTQLRPGEKLYEELLDNKEKLLKTYNDKIMIGQVRKHNIQEVNEQLLNLFKNLDGESTLELKKRLEHIVPEFKPDNTHTPSRAVKVEIAAYSNEVGII